MLATQSDFVVAPLSTVATPLLCVGVVAAGASTVLPPSSMASVASPSALLAVVVLPSSSSRPRVLFDHLYTFSDADSLWGATYKPEQKTPIGFVSTFDKNLIRSTRV